MKSLVIMAALLASGASAQSWKITATGKVIDKANCYAFQMPKGWKAAWHNPVPLLLHFAPGSSRVQLQTLPPGAASLAIAPGPVPGDKTKSIDEWIQWRRREYPSSSIREIRYPPGTGITRAVEMRWTDEEIDPGEPRTRTVALFFEFRGHPSHAYLDFYQTDKRRAQYLAAFAEVVGSLRPLTDSAAGSVGCSEAAEDKNAVRQPNPRIERHRVRP